jgi:hypothetical protein
MDAYLARYGILHCKPLFVTTKIFPELGILIVGVDGTESFITAASSGPIQSTHNDR